MPRDTVTVQAFNLNATTAWSGTAISPTNGAQVPVVKGEKTFFRVANTAGSAYNVTFKAGDGSTANLQGDLVESIPATTGDELFQLETARFMQNDGYIYVDFATSMTGTIYAYQLV